jgi:GNAT superfamily N-acetyltransferase
MNRTGMIHFADLKDDISLISQLIFQTDSIIPFIFGKEENALPKIKSLIENEDNSFSYQHIFVHKNDKHAIEGILLAYPPSKKDKRKELNIYQQIFSTKELLVLWFKSILLNAIDNKSEIDGIYIQNISVTAAARGKGIGTQLINFIEKWTLEQNMTSIWLDVAFSNVNAKKLYERQGFKVVSKHKLLFINNGFYRMKKCI